MLTGNALIMVEIQSGGQDMKLELWRMIMKNKVMMFWNKIIPSIHNLPQVIYIRWMNREWYIRK